MNNLKERCLAIIEWQDTGVMKLNALRDFAKSNDISDLRLAEMMTAREAMEFVVQSEATK